MYSKIFNCLIRTLKHRIKNTPSSRFHNPKNKKELHAKLVIQTVIYFIFIFQSQHMVLNLQQRNQTRRRTLSEGTLQQNHK
jgi:hypothetical protein